MVLNINPTNFVGISNVKNTSGISIDRDTRNRYITVPQSDIIDTTSEISKYANEIAIKNAIKTNPNLQSILKKAGIVPTINMNTIREISNEHLKTTRDTAIGVYNHLPNAFKAQVDTKTLLQAAILHDIGKSLIPKEILNKTGKLTDKERNIMELHSELGYEILKNSDIKPKTLELIKNHHQNAQLSGYPKTSELFIANLNTQILNVSDVYSALREKRSYKKALNKNEALAIIHKEVNAKNVHPFVFKALVDYANEQEKIKLIQELAKTKAQQNEKLKPKIASE